MQTLAAWALFASFNSYMVRLEVLRILHLPGTEVVSIPIWCDWKESGVYPYKIRFQFQFLYGAIGRSGRKTATLDENRFNSYMVRLEAVLKTALQLQRTGIFRPKSSHFVVDSQSYDFPQSSTTSDNESFILYFQFFNMSKNVSESLFLNIDDTPATKMGPSSCAPPQ